MRFNKPGWIMLAVAVAAIVAHAQSEHWLPGRQIVAAAPVVPPSEERILACQPIAGDALIIRQWMERGTNAAQIKGMIVEHATPAQRKQVERIVDLAVAWEGDNIDFAVDILERCVSGDMAPWEGADNYAQQQIRPGGALAAPTSLPLTDERAAEVYARAYTAYAAAHPGFRWPELAPVVHVTPVLGEHQLNGLMCLVDDKLWVEEYACKAGEVSVWDGVDMYTAEGAGTLFHEYIHYFQWLQHGRKYDDATELMNCEFHQKAETEAYTLELHELVRVGSQAANAIRFQIAAVARACLPPR